MSDILGIKKQINELPAVLAQQLREEVSAKVTSEVVSEVTAKVTADVTADVTAEALERLQRRTTQTFTTIDDSETAPGATNGDTNRESCSKS